MHLKFSIPLASVVFALVGVPLGIQSHRSASSSGFGLIIIIFLYYVLMSMGRLWDRRALCRRRWRHGFKTSSWEPTGCDGFIGYEVRFTA